MKIYDELAAWWPLLSAPESYAEEAGIYLAALRDAVAGPFETLLELGSGGGNTASHLKADLRLTLVDLSPKMLEVSRALNPECEHLVGDMRDVRLGRTFDAVLIHDAVMYMTDEAALAEAVGTAAAHLRPGGVALFVPDDTEESFRPRTSHGGHDAPDGRGLRYLAWCVRPDPDVPKIRVDYAFLFKAPDGAVISEHEVHGGGLFPRATWLRLIEEAGLDARAVPYEHSDWAGRDPGREMFLGVRPT